MRPLEPNVRLEYWAGSWLSQDSGQNWASRSYDLSSDADDGWHYRNWMDSRYSRAGFADLLDTFLLGTYLTGTYMAESAAPRETLEYQLARGQRYASSATTVYGNVVANNPAATIEEQTYYCLVHSDGVMVFDLCYFINDEARWAALKRGIERAEKELSL